ncbi:DUF4873 domain-containing protein [Streptomyces sp. V4I23]|uniref:DUF4873 domain-containing protein n=1 Tax=Streptomyces sp. V4I23 TaxID=3042282 RepID=UPI0027D7AC72|nr:DUF4873 domain-containing protein [Streptomyces sp. V4I23]
MDVYRGDATVIADGTEIPAKADLRSWVEQRHVAAFGPTEAWVEGAADWNGKLEVRDEEVADMVMHAAERHLRMPDGRVGDFVVSRRSFDAGLLVIEGSGDPPF